MSRKPCRHLNSGGEFIHSGADICEIRTLHENVVLIFLFYFHHDKSFSLCERVGLWILKDSVLPCIP